MAMIIWKAAPLAKGLSGADSSFPQLPFLQLFKAV